MGCGRFKQDFFLRRLRSSVRLSGPIPSLAKVTWISDFGKINHRGRFFTRSASNPTWSTSLRWKRSKPGRQSGGSRQIGELGVTLAIRPARGLAAVAECLEVARIAGRPAARAVREVDDRYFSVDRTPDRQNRPSTARCRRLRRCAPGQHWSYSFRALKLRKRPAPGRGKPRKNADRDEKRGLPRAFGRHFLARGEFFLGEARAWRTRGERTAAYAPTFPLSQNA